jgi:hypothetical protein
LIRVSIDRPHPHKVLIDIADEITQYQLESVEAYETVRLCCERLDFRAAVCGYDLNLCGSGTVARPDGTGRWVGPAKAQRSRPVLPRRTRSVGEYQADTALEMHSSGAVKWDQTIDTGHWEGLQ